MLAFLLIAVLALTYIVSTVVKPKNYPPGPRWYPFFGCNGIISSRMGKHGSQWKVLSEMAKEYSTNVLGLKLGSELVVVVYGMKNIRHVATEKEFDARPDSFFLRLRTFGKRTGLTFVDGPVWKEHRPFTLKILRNFGFGKRAMDVEIQVQLSQVLERLDNCKGTPINIRMFTAMAMLNVIWMYVAGQVNLFSGEHLEESTMKKLLNSISQRTKAFTMAGGYLNQWPWLRFIFPTWSGYSILQKLNSQMLNIIREAVIKHKNNNVTGNDLINSFLEEMFLNKEFYTDDQLNGICLDFLLASSSTGSSVLDFAIIMLLRHPEKQQKVYEEIKQVLGEHFPTWADSEKLVYTSAFIYEVHRCCTIAPFPGGRRALADVTIDGHVIPKGTTVLLSLGDLHVDSDMWIESDKFMPERFIDEAGQLKTTTNVYPFGIGRRRCLGEPFAKVFIFIMLAGIVQKYKIVCCGPPPSAVPVIGVLAEPRYFTAEFVKRLIKKLLPRYARNQMIARDFRIEDLDSVIINQAIGVYVRSETAQHPHIRDMHARPPDRLAPPPDILQECSECVHRTQEANASDVLPPGPMQAREKGNGVPMRMRRTSVISRLLHGPLASESFTQALMLAFLLIVVLALTYIVSTVIKPKNYPPGPRWYPFFGCNGIISSRMSKHGSQWKVLSEMAKEYSTNVLGLKLGSELVVVVYGMKNIRHVATEKEFDARPDSFFLRLRSLGKRIGITFVDGPVWREHRPFALKILRNFGFGKKTMDFEIQSQLSQLLERLENCNGSSVNIRNYTAMALLNIVWKYVAGEHIEEVKMKQVLNLMSARSKVFTMAGGYLNQWPWLRFILPRWCGYSIIMKLNSQLSSIIQESIKRHKDNLVTGDDLMNSFFKESSLNKELYTEDQLIGICLDFLIAGSNTGSSALDFAIIMLLRHPDKQQKVYEEIKHVLGDKLPTWADSEKLVYTSAFMCEVNRCCTIAPFAGGRRALADVTIDGHVIPKGTTVLLSLGDLHVDSDMWIESDKFMPERFIDEAGQLKTTTNVYPFGIGRRRCFGEPLAKAFMFIMFAGIVQKYKLVCSGPTPSAVPIIGILAEPVYFTARYVKRHDIGTD
ncbi:uncharacterized protein LOC112048657 [Bicyclus anynana]|uniref:Uncharacterized protein LOC112048657 n=1 Tax=Bicyclus anynana TaxID=110368 RepID=A0ABM3M5N5_BICAN|nr:uncharacterized protein LOC112048657 [Bicyclus anynana]